MAWKKLPEVLGVHKNMDYVVRFERGGEWGDTERHVKADRATLAEPGKVVGRSWKGFCATCQAEMRSETVGR